MARRKNKNSQTRPIWLTIFGILGLGILIAVLLNGTDIRLFNPKGLIAKQQLDLIILSVLIMLAFAVPILVLLFSFAWEYRETNKKASYDPEARQSKLFTFSIWAMPSIFMVLLALVMWPATFKLQPRNSIAADVKPLTIQVIAMRWKWVFIYPEQNIATVNYVQIPVGTPVEFQLSADETPMSSFWIPHLGGQLYAMTGHVNELNLLASEAGDYPGSSAEINGKGFSGMKFIARASSQKEFDEWVQNTKASPKILDREQYEELLKPSEDNPSEFFSPVQSDLYANMLMKYKRSQDLKSSQNESSQ